MALRGLGALLAASMTMSATGEVYRQVDPAGNVSYTDSAPGAGAERLDLPAAADEAAVDTTEPTDLVILYSAAWCNICDRARGWFDANGIDYIEYDVETDPQGREDYARLNGTGVPLIVVGGREKDEGTVSLRQRHGEQQGGLKIDDVIERFQDEVSRKVA